MTASIERHLPLRPGQQPSHVRLLVQVMSPPYMCNRYAPSCPHPHARLAHTALGAHHVATLLSTLLRSYTFRSRRRVECARYAPGTAGLPCMIITICHSTA